MNAGSEQVPTWNPLSLWPLNALVPPLRNLIPQLQHTEPSDAQQPSNILPPKETYESGMYLPTFIDVVVVKAFLVKLRVKDTYLPEELALMILNRAEYWAHTTTQVVFGEDEPELVYGSHNDREDKFLLRTPPLGFWRWDSRDLLTRQIQPKPAGGKEYPIDSFQKLAKAQLKPLSEDDAHPDLLAHPCRRIVFTIRSHDQGWGGDFEHQGTFQGSWTWFEAGVERWTSGDDSSELLSELSLEGKQSDDGNDDAQNNQSGNTKNNKRPAGPFSEDHTTEPSMHIKDLSTIYPEVEYSEDQHSYKFKHQMDASDKHMIQCNRLAERDWQDYRVVWSYDDDVDPERDVAAAARLQEAGRGKATGNGEFVRNLRLGDVVTVWARARFPGWVNNIASVKVDIFWAS